MSAFGDKADNTATNAIAGVTLLQAFRPMGCQLEKCGAVVWVARAKSDEASGQRGEAMLTCLFGGLSA